MTWLLDMDGVVWLRDSLIPGSQDAIALLRERGNDVAFVTNNSMSTPERYVEKLTRMGIPCDIDAIFTAALSLAACIEPGSRVLCVAGEGMQVALRERDIEVVDVETLSSPIPPPVDAVIVANRPNLRVPDLSLALRAVLNGATFYVPNKDPLYPVDDGFALGTGAIGSCITYATGVQPIYAGKPTEAMVRYVRAHVDHIDVMVGDQLETDGAFAHVLGVTYVQVGTGVSAMRKREIDGELLVHDVADLSEAVRLYA